MNNKQSGDWSPSKRSKIVALRENDVSYAAITRKNWWECDNIRNKIFFAIRKRSLTKQQLHKIKMKRS